MKYLLISLILLTTFVGVSPVKADLVSDQKKCIADFASKINKDSEQKDIDTLYLVLRQCQEQASLTESTKKLAEQALIEKNTKDIQPTPPPAPIANDIKKNITEQLGLSESDVDMTSISQTVSDSQLRQIQAKVRSTLKEFQRSGDFKSLKKYISALIIYDIQLVNLTNQLSSKDCFSTPTGKIFKEKLKSTMEDLIVIYRETSRAETIATLREVYTKVQGKNISQVVTASRGYCQGLIVSGTIEKLNKYTQERLGGNTSQNSELQTITAGLAKATGLVSTSTATYQKLISQNLNLKQDLAEATENMKLATSIVSEVNKVLVSALNNIKKEVCKQALFTACNLQQLSKSSTTLAGLGHLFGL